MKWTTEQKKAHSQRMKRIWAAKNAKHNGQEAKVTFNNEILRMSNTVLRMVGPEAYLRELRKTAHNFIDGRIR